MFRKIHSKRDPSVTVFSQIRQEFSPYFERGAMVTVSLLKSYPKSFFAAMVILLSCSACLSFTLMRNKEPVNVIHKAATVDVVRNGFEQISSAALAIKETIRLKSAIDSLSAKTTLSKQDIAALDSDLVRLQQLNQHLKR